LKKAAMEMELTSEDILSAVSLDCTGFARRVWGPYFYQLVYPEMQSDIWDYCVPVCHDLCFSKRRYLTANPFKRVLTPGDNPALVAMRDRISKAPRPKKSTTPEVAALGRIARLREVAEGLNAVEQTPLYVETGRYEEVPDGQDWVITDGEERR